MAIVLPAVGVVPLAVDPPDHCPVQMEQEQYPVSLNLPRYVPLEELLEVSDADGLSVVVEDALLSEELLPELLPLSELLPELLPPEVPPSELLPPDDSFVNGIPTTSLMI